MVPLTRPGKEDGMTNQQRPIGSSFAAAATADEVLRGIDPSGTNVVVTGGHVGPAWKPRVR